MTLVAGPNGSGKSTLTSAISFGSTVTVVDPDAIAREIDIAHPSRVMIAASRKTILRCRSVVAARADLVLESTLAGNGAISLMRDAKSAGYRTLLIYIALADAELHIERVRLRVSQGGHDVSDPDIRRRHLRSLSHAPKALQLADESVVFDNSGLEPVRMLTLKNGQVTWRAEQLPLWVQNLASELN